MTSFGSNVGSSSRTDSSGGPPARAWISLTFEEQFTNFKRIIHNQHSNMSFDGAFNFKSIARAMRKLRIDPCVDIKNLLPFLEDLEHFGVPEHIGTMEYLLFGTTPLHWAVLMDDRTMVRYILTSRRIEINASTRYWGETALHYAIIGGNHGIVEDLLEPKADEKVDVNLHNAFGYTPLHCAAKKGFVDVATCLLQQNADINALNNNGWSPLHVAAKEGAMNIVTLLVERNADVDALTKDGLGPLHIAVGKGYLDIVTCLVEHNANVDALTKDGLCPLYIVAEKGYLDIVTCLVEHNANVNSLDNDGLGPLYIATMREHLDIVSLLVKQNANVDTLTKNGFFPLHIAALKGYLDIITCLVEHNANVNALDKDGYYLLHSSITNQWINTSKKLITIGVDVHVKDKWSNNALHLAIQAHGREHNMMEIVKLLRERDVDANAKNSQGYSPFFAAVAEGHIDVVTELLQNKEKLKLMEECNGQTAIQIAFDNGHEHIKRALLVCDDVSRYVGDLYRDRQVYVDAANAILVGAALIASVTFASWLQPPLGYTTSYLDLAPSSSDIDYVDVQHNVSLRAFWVFNALSFYFAIGTVVFGARSVLPRRRMFIKAIVVKLHRNLLVTSILLACSVFFVIIAFGIAGCIVLTPTLKFQWYMIVPTVFGGLVCLISLGLLFKSMVEDNLEKRKKEKIICLYGNLNLIDRFNGLKDRGPSPYFI